VNTIERVMLESAESFKGSYKYDIETVGDLVDQYDSNNSPGNAATNLDIANQIINCVRC